jgi:hypothetical protein
MQQISRPKHKSYDPFRRSQMTECLHITLIYFLPHVVVGKVCVIERQLRWPAHCLN